MKSSKVVGIVQARMGSTRLPGKVMRNIQGKPMIHWVVDRLCRSKFLDDVVVAVPDTPENDDIRDWCLQNRIIFSSGDEDNVLLRYYEAACAVKADYIVRVTADCPLIDPNIVDLVAAKYFSSFPYPIYVSNTIRRTYPRGLDAEIFSFSALHDLREASLLHPLPKSYLEHVTPYFYTDRSGQCLNASNPKDYSYMRLTVDEEKDFDLICEIFSHMRDGYFSWMEVVQFLEEHRYLLSINEDVKQKEWNEYDRRII